MAFSRKIKTFSIFSIMIVAISLFSFLVLKNNQKTQENKNLAQLVVEQGSANVKTKDSSFTIKANENVETAYIPSGSEIETQQNSIAHVIFPDNSIMSIDQNTKVQINYNDKKISIFQIAGNTWHRVKKLINITDYSVETPTALASVRGTIFGVQINQDETSVYVKEHTVEVAKIQKQDGKTKILEKVNVNEGDISFVKQKEKIQKQKFDKQKLKDKVNLKFIQENEQIENIDPEQFIQKVKQIKQEKIFDISQLDCSNFEAKLEFFKAQDIISNKEMNELKQQMINQCKKQKQITEQTKQELEEKIDNFKENQEQTKKIKQELQEQQRNIKPSNQTPTPTRIEPSITRDPDLNLGDIVTPTVPAFNTPEPTIMVTPIDKPLFETPTPTPTMIITPTPNLDIQQIDMPNLEILTPTLTPSITPIMDGPILDNNLRESTILNR